MIETVYVSQKSKDQLVKIKRTTGIQNWNILCRWAFCISLKDDTRPALAPEGSEHAIEMTWKVFGGVDHQIYWALLINRCKRDNIPLSKDSIVNELHAHLNRGLSHLIRIKGIDTLISKTIGTTEQT